MRPYCAEKFDELGDKDGIRKWAFGVARCQAMAWLRDKARDPSLDETRLASQRDALEECLKRLPADQRMLFSLSADEGEVENIAITHQKEQKASIQSDDAVLSTG